MRTGKTALAAAAVLGVAALAAGILAGCADGPRHPGRRPLIVFGIDGGEWRVIEDLWSRGRLPNLRALADRGVTARLGTAYGASPVIWTTIATGRRPGEHGITGFVTWKDGKAIPVSSASRRVPAIWNMTSRMGLRTAVFGWWATWPAESIRGVVVSDRAEYDLDRRVSPAEYLPTYLEDLETARQPPNPFRGNEGAALRDRAVSLTARRLTRDFDVQLIYFRSVDIASHNFWKFYEPERFENVDPAAVARYRDEIPEAYAAVDAAIGEILAAADPDADVLVVSDHGFRALREEKVRIRIDLDQVLRRLGYRNKNGELNCRRSRLYVHQSTLGELDKMVRFCLAGRDEGGRVTQGRRRKVRRQFEKDLATVTFSQGEPAFEVRDPRPHEKGRGADFVVSVRSDFATDGVLLGGRPQDDLVRHLDRISGGHGEHTGGVFFAAGPDIDPQADLEGLHIHDLAPTLLYALGLPVGEDFAGTARTGLFNEDFRRTHSLRTVPTWGEMESWRVETSEADEEIVEELRALGYL